MLVGLKGLTTLDTCELAMTQRDNPCFLLLQWLQIKCFYHAVPHLDIAHYPAKSSGISPDTASLAKSGDNPQD